MYFRKSSFWWIFWAEWYLVPGFGLSETETGFILGFLESEQLGACFSLDFFADFLELVLDLEHDLVLRDLEDLESDLEDLERDLESDLELGFLESEQLGACFSSDFFADFLELVLDLEVVRDLEDLESDLEDLERDLELLLELSMNSAEMGFLSFLGELGSGSVDRLDDRVLGLFLYSLNLLLLRFWLSRHWLNFFSRFLTELSTKSSLEINSLTNDLLVSSLSLGATLGTSLGSFLEVWVSFILSRAFKASHFQAGCIFTKFRNFRQYIHRCPTILVGSLLIVWNIISSESTCGHPLVILKFLQAIKAPFDIGKVGPRIAS